MAGQGVQPTMIKEKKQPIYGFVPPKLDSSHYVLGSSVSLPKEIIQPDGQWDKFLPPAEEQAKYGLETYNCTSFNTLNAIEILAKRIYGLDLNLSDRDLGIRAGTRPPGNDPHVVAEALRNDGVCFEVTLPFTSDLADWQEYYSYKGADKTKCDVEAAALVFKFEFGHEWVFTGPVSKEVRNALMKEALTYSPLCVSVSAWNEVDGVFVDAGMPNNHWTVVPGWNNKGWKCRDSYPDFDKVISPDHNIGYCKRYRLVLKEVQAIGKEPTQSWFSRLISKIKNLWTKTSQSK